MLSNLDFVADLEDCIPLKRVAETHEITGVIAFLCMPASSFPTGQTICIDGGLTAHGLYDLYYSKHIILLHQSLC
jgi:Tropinone reductase 1